MIAKIRKKYLYYAAVILILLSTSSLFLYKSQKNDIYINEKGMLASSKLKLADYKTFPYESNENYNIKKVIYNSFGKDIYGFISEPKGAKIIAGVVLLPGAGVDKKSELAFAKQIAMQGYAVITIDQRGVGETDGGVPTLEEDFNSYSNGNIAVQHLMILDALYAADILRTEKRVSNNNIIMMGESLGGRIAMISAALDKRVKGVIAIISAGFHFNNGNDKKSRFIKSIDPDGYMAKIAPRKIVMVHNRYDKNVPFDSALLTLEKAKEPKEFILFNDTKCNHGFCDSMFNDINSSLASMIR
ncbi:alpha/beta fold hydrolase [Candidatus Woesearchaeota archaeon]|nr:alpha/beta fold hydrolase [Candidatus Woesearchaeota archaeon]